MKRRVCLFIFTVMICSYTYAQKRTTQVQQFWAAYLNQTRLSDHWGIGADLHLRTRENFFENLSTGIARVGLTYYANENLRFTAGYGFVNYFPADNHSGVSQPEHRPWQQVQWFAHGKRSRLMNWIRLEERFRRKIINSEELGEGYNFNYRLRYNFLLMLPLSTKAFAPKTLSFVLNDEVHINMGKEIVYNYFDQNRFFAGFAYHINKSDYIQFGYLNVFQQLAAGNSYRSIHAPRVFYYHNIDLRKK